MLTNASLTVCVIHVIGHGAQLYSCFTGLKGWLQRIGSSGYQHPMLARALHKATVCLPPLRRSKADMQSDVPQRYRPGVLAQIGRERALSLQAVHRLHQCVAIMRVFHHLDDGLRSRLCGHTLHVSMRVNRHLCFVMSKTGRRCFMCWIALQTARIIKHDAPVMACRINRT